MDDKEIELLLHKASLGYCTKEELMDAKEMLVSAVEDKNSECADYEQVIQMMNLEGKDSNNPDEVKKAMESCGVGIVSQDKITNEKRQRDRLAKYLVFILG